MTLRLAVFLGDRGLTKIWLGFLWKLSKVFAALTFPSLFNSLLYWKATTSFCASLSNSQNSSNLSMRDWILSFPCFLSLKSINGFFLLPTPCLSMASRSGQVKLLWGGSGYWWQKLHLFLLRLGKSGSVWTSMVSSYLARPNDLMDFLAALACRWIFTRHLSWTYFGK